VGVCEACGFSKWDAEEAEVAEFAKAVTV